MNTATMICAVVIQMLDPRPALPTFESAVTIKSAPGPGYVLISHAECPGDWAWMLLQDKP